MTISYDTTVQCTRLKDTIIAQKHYRTTGTIPTALDAKVVTAPSKRCNIGQTWDMLQMPQYTPDTTIVRGCHDITRMPQDTPNAARTRGHRSIAGMPAQVSDIAAIYDCRSTTRTLS
ncbi:15425_t:CDS:2 [Acaulospora morrowiae]|uniref:15425_t:CDS:1 n=1 Tax=Acaulospora morrowiae TaxID=94023 RepID=A0A9N9DAP7_9GLOM|nr:15425_t:CDS:2 [Acaulospora morrowiae]